MAKWLGWLADAWRNLWIRAGNLRRSLSRQRLDYVYLELEGSLPEFVSPPPWWRRILPMPRLVEADSRLSLSGLRHLLDRIAQDPRPRGVVLHLDELSVGWSKAESLRQAIQRLRKAGKRVIAYASDYYSLNYYIAIAADEILAPPVAGWNLVGLRLELVFLKDFLKDWGVEAEVITVSPYKTGGDTFTRAEISPEHRENLDSILDRQLQTLVEAIAASRNLDEDLVRDYIDQAPLTADEALQAGLLDSIRYLDEMASYLAGMEKSEETGDRPSLTSWRRADRLLRRVPRWRSGKSVAVVPLEGLIVRGRSRRLPLPFSLPYLGNRQAGATSINQALRQVEKDPRIAGVVLYVNSRGGSGLASELIYREMRRLAKRKPVVVYLADSATSGGYYVAVPANWIVAQPLTLTGSIGVYALRFNLDGLYEYWNVGRIALQRGRRADLFSDSGSLTEEKREVIARFIFQDYDRFKENVRISRELDTDRLDEVVGGRVWLGSQALENGLVDQLGDLTEAISKASQLAGLPDDRWTPTLWVSGGEGNLLPDPFPFTDRGARPWWDSLRDELVWLLDPFQLRIR